MEKQMIHLNETKVFAELLSEIPEDTKAPIKHCFNIVYESLLAAEISLDNGEPATNHEESLIKMFGIMKSTVAPELDYFCYDALLKITEKHLHDHNHPLFPFYVGLRTILLQRLWNRHARALLLHQKNPIFPELKFVVDSVDGLTKILLGLLKHRGWNLLHAQLIMCSLMLLLHAFYLRPMQKKTENKMLSVKQPEISGRQFQQIVNFTEFYVFQVGSRTSKLTANIALQSKILLNIAELVRNNTKVPETYHLFKIVRFFRNKSIFKNDIHYLLTILFEKKEVFCKTIALVIIDFARLNRDMLEFMQFVVCLNQFLYAINATL